MMTRRLARGLCAGSLGAAFAMAALAASCSVPALDLSGKKCASSQDCNPGQVCSSGAQCVSAIDAGQHADTHSLSPDGTGLVDASKTVDICHHIPHYGGMQLVDGFNTDFSSVPKASYPWGGSHTTVVGAAIGDHLDVTAQVAWSSTGMHMFFHVEYETGVVIPPAGADPLYYGDSMELFLKGNSVLTGVYNGVLDPGAKQIITAADPTNPPRTQAFDDYGRPAPLGAVSSAVHRDARGYDLEFMVSWASILPDGGTSPIVGDAIGLDFAVDYRPRIEGGVAPQYQILLSDVVLQATDACHSPIPSCDDRTWCVPVLDP